MTSPPHDPQDRAPEADAPATHGGPAPREVSVDAAAPDEGRAPALRQGLLAAWPRIDRTLFAAYAGACVLVAAMAFYRSMHQQTGGVWSAPLDDVFIHFDYARATARGYPFEWSEGNGFSSGNTSLTYPFVLALGYLMGFRGLLLMQWAAVVACVSTLGFLLAGARLLDPIGRWAKYLLPPVALCVGALDWTLFSGMENAFHLGVWALLLVSVLGLRDAVSGGAPPGQIARRGWLAGLAGAALFATRPESAVCVAAFAFYAAIAVRRGHPGDARARGRAGLAAIARASLPGALVFVAQAAANRALTGEWSANGAIAKLALNSPYMTAAEKWDTYTSLARYVVYRNTEHHFSDMPRLGWLLPAIALLPLACRATRGFAIVLWAHVIGWLALVALNGQVRWQNERYTMPAVAWLLVLAAIGLALLVARAWPRRDTEAGGAGAALTRSRAGALLWAGRVLLAGALAVAFWTHQLPKMRDQIWFFGRASRNIRDQHLVAGRILKELDVRRVLVGDAGGLVYAADRPGLDLIGLGGYHDLPFARAGVHGLGASLELIERLTPQERPDAMALYPTWWGGLPGIFGRRLLAVPVVGNVICGGAEKVIYRADWTPLERRSAPAGMRPDEQIADEIDVADLLSEREHDYNFPRPSAGFVGYDVLASPRDRGRDLFDAGRLIPDGRSETARVRAPRGGGRLVVRTTTSRDVAVEVTADGASLGTLRIRGGLGWAEADIALPAGLPETFTLALTPVRCTWSDYHVWILERAAPDAARPLAGH